MKQSHQHHRRAGDAAEPRSIKALLFDCIAGPFEILESWRKRHQASMQLARIDTRVLRDAGISDAQRFAAVNKPFWRQ